MGRKPRIHEPEAVYHVIMRGNARQDIFADDRDRYRFYEIMEKSLERFRHRVLAFCLMTNHVHLAIQVADVPLSRIMQSVSQRYTQWCNWRHKKTGHVFQGRYKAILVDADSFLLELAAYIHLNPVRAGISSAAEVYPWSSHRSYLGKEAVSWLDPVPVLSMLSSNFEKARCLFSSFVADRTSDGRRSEFHGEKNLDGRLLGDRTFVEGILTRGEPLPARKPDIETIIDAVKKIYGIDEESLRAQGQERVASEARSLAAWATLELSSGKLTELAPRLRRNPSTLSCAAKRLDNRRKNDLDIAGKVWRMCQEVQ